MPIYEYLCNHCGEQTEFIQKFNESPKVECPHCHEQTLTKLISAASFHLKGTGWYVTDYKDQGKKPKEEKGEQTKEAKSTEKTKTDTTSQTTKDKKQDKKQKE